MTRFIQGETITYSLADANYTTVNFNYGATYAAMTKSGTTWSVSIASSSLSGLYRYAIIADGHAVETGSFYVSALVSKYREVVEAIDSALQGVAENGKYSLTVGEITMTDKTFDEMVKARNFYERLANADEMGQIATHAPTRIEEIYA